MGADLLRWLKPEPFTPAELAAAERLAPGDEEIYGEKINTILDEAREIFVRTGITGMLHSGDLIVGIYRPNGDLVAASCGTYLHAVTAQLPVKYVIRRYLHDPSVGVHDGDVFYCNEARIGGIHNPDQMAIMPVFVGDRLVAWSVAAVHQSETGATEPGGMPVTARSKYDEGMRLVPIKLVERFRFREDLLEMMANMVDRASRTQMVDTRARVTACDRLRMRLLELAEAKGSEFLEGLAVRMIKRSAEGARRRVRGWNDGTYRAVAFLDTIGWKQRLIRVCLELRKRDDRLTFDFSGTSPENDGSFNAFPHIAAAHCAVYLYAFAFSDLPISAGTYEPLDFEVPDGCYLSAAPDAAVSNSPSACVPVVSVTNLGFSRLLFDSDHAFQVTAPIGNGTSGVMYAGVNQHGVRLADLAGYPLNTAGAGARSDADGVDAYGFPLGHFGKAPDAEDVENEFPFLHLFQKFRRDSAGPGRYRGGAGTETAWVLHLAPRFVFQSVASHTKIPTSSGIFGGYPPAARPGIRIVGSDVLDRLARGDPDIPPSADELVARRPISGEYIVGPGIRPSQVHERGDIYIGLSPGGAGYGDVLDREPAAVMDDVRRELISRWTAERVYHVAFDPVTLTPDLARTLELREAERRARLARGVSYADFEREWLRRSPAPEILEYFGAWPTGAKVREIIRI